MFLLFLNVYVLLAMQACSGTESSLFFALTNMEHPRTFQEPASKGIQRAKAKTIYVPIRKPRYDDPGPQQGCFWRFFATRQTTQRPLAAGSYESHKNVALVVILPKVKLSSRLALLTGLFFSTGALTGVLTGVVFRSEVPRRPWGFTG